MYGKLFAQMYDGTLATKGPWKALVTFQQFIILADKNGVVDMTAEAISRRTTIPLEIIEEGILKLQEPDPDSRTPDEEGRRIALLSPERTWGWQIVNYAHYRNLRSTDERRQYHQQYYHEKRKKKPVSTNSTLSTDSTKAVSSKHKAVDLGSFNTNPRNKKGQNLLKEMPKKPDDNSAAIEKNRRIAAAQAAGNLDIAKQIRDENG